MPKTHFYNITIIIILLSIMNAARDRIMSIDSNWMRLKIVVSQTWQITFVDVRPTTKYGKLILTYVLHNSKIGCHQCGSSLNISSTALNSFKYHLLLIALFVHVQKQSRKTTTVSEHKIELNESYSHVHFARRHNQRSIQSFQTTNRLLEEQGKKAQNRNRFDFTKSVFALFCVYVLFVRISKIYWYDQRHTWTRVSSCSSFKKKKNEKKICKIPNLFHFDPGLASCRYRWKINWKISMRLIIGCSVVVVVAVG